VEFTGRLRDELATDRGYCIRRVVLDELLVRTAQVARAELREGVTVTRLEWAGDSVCGVTAQDQTTAFREPARVVIGADGRYSRVARWVRAETSRHDPAVTPGYYAYYEGVHGPRDTLTIMRAHRRDYLLFPTDGNLTCVLVALPQEELHAFRQAHERHFQADIEAVPELRDRFANARRVGAVRGATDLESYLRVPIGPGWALVGDAGAHIHPVTARGIGLAVRDALNLGDALADALEGRRDPGEALLEYHQLRDAETLPQYERALGAAKMTGRPMPPQMLELWRALGRLPDAADAYVQGRLPVRSAEDLGKLVERAGATEALSPPAHLTRSGTPPSDLVQSRGTPGLLPSSAPPRSGSGYGSGSRGAG
jgi:flavin-dependent dehydrogenase